MVSIRKAIESTYTGTCTIIEHQKILNADKSTGFQDVPVLTGQRCRVSFSTVKSVNQSDGSATAIQVVKLFIAPEIQVKPGSKLIVTQDGVTTEYKQSGQAAPHGSHQEIVLELFDKWV